MNSPYFINIISGLAVVAIVWLINYLIPRVTKYQVVIVDRKSWKIFNEGLPLLSKAAVGKARS